MNRARNIVLLALVALLVLPAFASAARSTGAVVFSRVTATTTEPKEEKGGLFAVRDGRLNQLTENAADTEPSFSPDGRTIAFVRDGDVYSVRADGSGERHLSSGAELDSAPDPKAAATAARELRQAMAVVRAAAPPKERGDKIDQLAERRAQRLSPPAAKDAP